MPNPSPSTGYAFGQKISCSAPTTTTSTSETTTITSAPTTTANTTTSATTTTTSATTTTNSCYPTGISNTCQDFYLFADGDRIYNERCNIQLSPVNAPLNGGGETVSLISTCVKLCTADVDCSILSWDPSTNLCKLYDSMTGFGVGSVVAVFKYGENSCSSDTVGSTSTQITTTTTATLLITSVTTTSTEVVVTPTCAPLSDGGFEERSNDWSIPVIGTDTDSGIYSADDNPWGYTTPHGSDFVMLRYADNVGLGTASQSLTEIYGTYSVSFSWSIPTMTKKGGDNPYCMVSNGEFVIRPFCNPGGSGQCDCDVLVDNVVVTSVNATCADGGEVEA
ncbi:hypothetical protein LTR24_001587 [Lithohypha guttulata]|uniref:Apple domain-containing protein n=1 Tax=Lithohypha guttulata TaxID=1690604 RepID=A0ABR0KK40_9EURO|nr:hypothetical protein LTR24_001587 [Lithohypha guttulata]